MTPQFDALLRGTKQPRLAEKGKPYFMVIEKPVIVKSEPITATPPNVLRACIDWYPVVLIAVAAFLVVGLIVGNQLWWR